jgi:Ala-tRNA(Pro) deacylase
MNSPHKIEEYLDARNVPYEIVLHKRTITSLDTAHAAHIDASRVAKAVLLEGDGCFMAALVPADQDVRLGKLIQDYGPHLRLADEEAIGSLFQDCDSGVVPGFPPAWGMETVWDDDLLAQPDVYLNAGDHVRLIHVETRYLRELLSELAHCHFSAPKKHH